MHNLLPLLLVPEKSDPESDAVCEAWIQRGGNVRRLGKYWIMDENIASKKIALYGNQTFSLVLEQIYAIKLISPDDTLIAKLERKWTGRTIQLKPLREIASTDFPLFVKPVIPKMFVAGVYQEPDAFERAVHGLKGEEQVLVSEIVHIETEARAFVLNGKIMDISLYEGHGNLAESRKYLETFIAQHLEQLPASVVIDLAHAPKKGWFILEFNAAWGAGLNGCDAHKVLDCIVNSTVNE